jgi:ABC-type nitrate/sulfonate/bicarbonate transport system substrate-binding protein
MNTVRIRLLWHAQAQFAGYHIAEQHRLASTAGTEIACEPIVFGESGTDAVLAGKVEMAVASPSHLLEAKDPAALAFILAIQQESPLVYPAKRTSGIADLADLEGRKVGVWPGHEDLELRWMLRRAGVDERKVERVPVNDTVAALVEDRVAAAQMTVYHELHQAEHRLGSDALLPFAAQPYGASLLKDGLLARRDWLASNGAVAQAVVDAVLQGWTIAFTDAEAALAACAVARPDMAREEHAAQLRDIRALSLRGATLAHGLGYPDAEHVARALQAMREVGLTAPALDPAAVADRRFWQAAPARWRADAWPTT